MAFVDKYTQQKAEIHLLVSQQFPFYRQLRAAEGNVSFGLPDPKSYLENAIALEKKLGAMALKEPDQFNSLVREGRFRALGKTLPFTQCHTYIAEKLFPDDGYPTTIEQRDKCAQEYALVLHTAVSAGILPMINPHTKLAFDRARLLPIHFQDGLVPINRISVCLRKEDQCYADKFPKVKPEPYRVSQAPEPITPIRPSVRVSTPVREAPAEKKIQETPPVAEINLPETRTAEGIQLWEIADEYANANRVDGGKISLNDVCKYLEKSATRKLHKDLLSGGKGWHGASWLKSPGRLKGWIDPKFRK